MRVVITAGGTGGHIYPALAVINKIKSREKSDFLYIGTHNRMEKDIIPKYDIPFEMIEVYGLSKKNLMQNFKAIKCFYRSYQKCLKLLRDFKPDVVVGFGGYVTVPVIMAAKKLKIPTLIHEQNSVAGKANIFLSRYATKIAVSFPSSMSSFDKEKSVLTGNPCSEEALTKKALEKSTFNLHENKKLVLIVMGSLGASKVNNFLKQSMQLFKNKTYEVLFVTGKKDYEIIMQNKYPSNVKIVPYIDGLTGIMQKSDLVVSRAGASTLSEIMALKVPSILIPSPYVPNNHQYKNAKDLATAEVAVIIEEKDLKGDILVRTIDNILKDEVLNEMKKGFNNFDVQMSATKMYELIKSMIDKEVTKWL